MTTVLGLIGILVFIVGVIALAAAMTWIVVKLTPTRDKKPTEAAG